MTALYPPDSAGKPTDTTEDGTVVLQPHPPVIGNSRHGEFSSSPAPAGKGAGIIIP
jgi:hypothetical protein